jgi:hypothetical protein
MLFPHAIGAAQFHNWPVDGFVCPGKGTMGAAKHQHPPFAVLIFDRITCVFRMPGTAYAYAGLPRCIATSNHRYPAASGNIPGKI